jgi:benzoyl-CoA reductase subunit C
MALEKIVEYCQELYEDLDFTSVRQWKEAGENRKVIGHMPVYVPREMIHAAGMLPVGILGGGDQLDVIHGDAYYQSYICRIPRSTIELSVTGRLDCLDGMLFPSTCDVIRNLSVSMCRKTSTWMSAAYFTRMSCNPSATNLPSLPDAR